MARALRHYVPGASVHVIQRGNNRGIVFSDAEDRERFLELVTEASERYGTSIHGFVLMDTHYHLLLTPNTAIALPRTIKQFGGEYVQFYNRKYDRIGTLWSGRYRSIVIKDALQWLNCARYIDQNPVAANIVDSPEKYRWSSFRAHACEPSPRWLTEHPVYTSLGATTELRQSVYRALCGVM